MPSPLFDKEAGDGDARAKVAAYKAARARIVAMRMIKNAREAGWCDNNLLGG